ncbi:MAG: outer membrane beta-barrel protein [Bernardetiaceae bacterium]|nr:outer membrane beta-barrel protein [Bernardetiaceae bacterium]
MLISAAWAQEDSASKAWQIGLNIAPELSSSELFIYRQDEMPEYTNRVRPFLGYQIGLSAFKPLGSRLQLNVGLGYSRGEYEKDTYHAVVLDNVGNEVVRGGLQRSFFFQEVALPVAIYFESAKKPVGKLFTFASLGTELRYAITLRVEDTYTGFSPDIEPGSAYHIYSSNRLRFNFTMGAGVGYQVSKSSAIRIEPNLRFTPLKMNEFNRVVPRSTMQLRFTFTHNIGK